MTEKERTYFKRARERGKKKSIKDFFAKLDGDRKIYISGGLNLVGGGRPTGQQALPIFSIARETTRSSMRLCSNWGVFTLQQPSSDGHLCALFGVLPMEATGGSCSWRGRVIEIWSSSDRIGKLKLDPKDGRLLDDNLRLRFEFLEESFSLEHHFNKLAEVIYVREEVLGAKNNARKRENEEQQVWRRDDYPEFGRFMGKKKMLALRPVVTDSEGNSVISVGGRRGKRPNLFNSFSHGIPGFSQY